MSKIKITVTKVSDKTTNGNFIHTLKSEGTKVQFLGQEMQGSGLTYFVALKGASAVGKSEVIDLEKFDIVERPLDVVDETTGEERTLMLKWLYPKR